MSVCHNEQISGDCPREAACVNRVDAKERLIVALDLPDVETASAMVGELREVTGFFKVGLSLQLTIGIEGLIQSLLDDHKKQKAFSRLQILRHT
jgi:orotidine-5'-phosphate decarboxylase